MSPVVAMRICRMLLPALVVTALSANLDGCSATSSLRFE